jgi:hypothetical protein
MRLSHALALIAVALVAGADVSTQSPGPQVIDLATGGQDFLITPVKRPLPLVELSQHHQAIASGDLNGDGIGDIVMGGAGRIDVPPIVGQVYVVFGAVAAGGLADLTNPAHVGVKLVGADPGDMFGWSVAVGDLNNDGQDDLIVGALRGDGAANSLADAGDVYVFMGPLTGGVINAASADTKVYGVDPGDFFGFSLGAGDVSGDGAADLIVGARDSDGFGNALVGRAGETHVLFGPLSSGTIDLASTPADVSVYGGTADYNLGASVAAGDVSGDNIADLVMGAPRSNSSFGGVNRGDTHVFFGPLVSGTIRDLRTAVPDVSITGRTNSDHVGSNVAVADISGDGIGDLLTAADIAWNFLPGSPNFNQHVGAVYAFFGPLTSGTRVLATASDVTTYIPDSTATGAVSSMATGDVNGDGAIDLVIGARFGNGLLGPPPLGRSAPGEAYAVFGPFSSGTILDLATTSPDITVNGRFFSGQLGVSVAAGDVTGDGVDDLLLEASFAQYPGSGIGEAYVIFGTSPNRPATTMTLSPATAAGVVGQEHCVIALASDASGNPPFPAVTVRFSATGGNAAQGSSTTTDNGQASFCYTGTISGTDTIGAFADTDGDGLQSVSEPGSSATVLYSAGDPATLTLTPSAATSIVDASHCTTAIVRDQFGNAVPNAAVSFAAAGIAPEDRVLTTGATGQAILCHTSALPGVDAIHAYADVNNDGTQSPNEPGADAINTWTLPPAAPGCQHVWGEGSFQSAAGRARYTLAVMHKPRDGAADGVFVFHTGDIRFHSTTIALIVIAGDSVTIHGVGRDGRGPAVPFRVDAGPDTIRISWPGFVTEGSVRDPLGIRAKRARHPC